MNFEVGQRVEVWDYENFICEGTVIYLGNDGLYHVARDDDCPDGSGVPYISSRTGYSVSSWRADSCELKVMSGIVKPDQKEPAHHIMGLSSETIDPEKYDAFMRDLSS